MALSFAACADGHHVATLEAGRLAVYALDGSGLGAPIATASVDGDEVVACGSALLVLADDVDQARATAYTVPGLAPLSALELPGRPRLLATAGPTALFARADEAFLLVLVDGTLSVGELRPPATFTRAVGVDDDQLVTFGPRGTELWMPSQRRPTARLGLTVPPDITSMGVTLRSSALWMTGPQPMIHTARLSDGRMTTLRLDGVPTRVTGCAGSSYLLAELAGRPVAINLALRQLEPLDPGPGTIIGQAVGADRVARVVVRLGDRVVATALGADGAIATALAEPAPAPAAVGPLPPGPRPDTGVIATPPRPGTSAARPAVRTVGAEAAPASAPVASAPVASASVASAPVATAPVASAPVASASVASAPVASAPVASAPVASASVASAPVASASSASAPVATPPTPPAPAPAPAPPAPVDSRAPWRDQLLAWARGGRPIAPPPTVLAAFAPLAHRGRLSPSATALVAAAYAAWLDGDGAGGVAVARLAALCDDWREACGAGLVAALGLVAWDRGRARLEAPLGELLDEQRPRGLTIVGGRLHAPPPPGLHELEPGESAELAQRFGVVAIAGPDLTRSRLEAWLRGLPLVIDHRVEPAGLRPGEALFLLPGR